MKTKTKKASKAKVAKVVRKVAPVEVPAALAAEAKKQMAREDISVCEAIRNTSKKFAKMKRAAVVKVFAGTYKINPHTVTRQVQEGRAAA